MEVVVTKMACWRGSVRDNPKGGELDLAEGVRRRCKKNFILFPFYPA